MSGPCTDPQQKPQKNSKNNNYIALFGVHGQLIAFQRSSPRAHSPAGASLDGAPGPRGREMDR